MTSDPRTAPQAALSAPGGDLLGELVAVLAEVLDIKAETIDCGRPSSCWASTPSSGRSSWRASTARTASTNALSRSTTTRA
ncbi:hypothetical protein [Streptomyces sp. 4N124]|uniref:hypothetical protein n=1 Tax=Streptomyces sp. 4N124 TaxID=3457420 RepID=UPI003FD453D3